MAWNNFTAPTPVQDIYKPIDDSIFLHGAQQNYKRAEGAAQNVNAQYNKLFNISTYGKDAEVLAQLDSTFQTQVAELSKQGLNQPEVQNQINSLISQYSTNPDVLAVHQRKAFYDSESKKMQEAMEKGRNYISPGLEALTGYYSGDAYYRKPKTFSMSQGFVAPKLSELQKTAQELTPKKKRWETLPNGERQQIEYQDTKDLKNVYRNLIAQDPNGAKYIDYTFNQNYGNIDWDNEGRNKIAGDINRLENHIYELQSDGMDATPFIEQVNKLNKLYDSGAVGESLKEQTKNMWFDDFTNEYAEAVDYVNQGDIKMGDYDKAMLAHRLNKDEAAFKAKLEAGLVKGIPAKANDLDKEIYKAVLASGKAIYNNDGTLIPASQLASQSGLAYNAAESRDALTSGATKTKKITLGKDSDAKTIDKETVLNDLNGGNIQTIKKILETYPDRFGATEGIDEGRFGYGIKIVDGNVTWQDDDIINDDPRSIPLKDMMDFVKNLSQEEEAVEPSNSESTSGTTNTNIASPSNFNHSAKLGNDTIYSIDGNNWYNTQGTKVE